MKFPNAPQFIKFALGENVKQSNWGNNPNRFPQSRGGVEHLTFGSPELRIRKENKPIKITERI